LNKAGYLAGPGIPFFHAPAVLIAAEKMNFHQYARFAILLAK
jgi:hypothetical protein